MDMKWIVLDVGNMAHVFACNLASFWPVSRHLYYSLCFSFVTFPPFSFHIRPGVTTENSEHLSPRRFPFFLIFVAMLRARAKDIHQVRAIGRDREGKGIAYFHCRMGVL